MVSVLSFTLHCKRDKNKQRESDRIGPFFHLFINCFLWKRVLAGQTAFAIMQSAIYSTAASLFFFPSISSYYSEFVLV